MRGTLRGDGQFWIPHAVQRHSIAAGPLERALSIGLILIGGNHLLRSSPRISFTFRRDVREIAPGVRGCTATDVRSGILVGKRWKIWDLSGRDRREGPE